MNDGAAYEEAGRYRVTVTPHVNMAEDLPDGARVETIDYELYHIHGDRAERLDVSVEEDEGFVESLTFETDGFSAFVLKYTVDFKYENPETGETYGYSL